MFSSIGTDHRDEGDVGSYSPAFKCRVAHCSAVMSYSLALIADARHVW